MDQKLQGSRSTFHETHAGQEGLTDSKLYDALKKNSKQSLRRLSQPFERQCHHYKKVSESRRLQKLWNSYCADYGAHTELLFHGKCSCFLEVFGPSLNVSILWCGPMLSVFGSGHPLHLCWALFFSAHQRTISALMASENNLGSVEGSDKVAFQSLNYPRSLSSMAYQWYKSEQYY